MEESALNQKILELSDRFAGEVLELRHAIHRDPELSFKEYRTAERVEKALADMNIPCRKGIAGTGIVADLTGSAPGKTLLLRADMDALPLDEETDLPFRSQNPGVMHACGHDVHTANLVGVARILSELRPYWKGKVRFVFQPAEESGGGGREMIREGIFDDCHVDASIALHTMATLPPGHISIGWENVTSYSDRFTIIVHGKKTHSSRPENGVDAISIAAQIIVAMNGILLKNIDPMDRATYSVGSIQGGTAPGIIPDRVEMVGMMRNVTGETRAVMRKKIEETACGIAKAMGGSAEFLFREGYPSVYNDPALTDFVAEHIEKHIGSWLGGIVEQPDRDDWLVREKLPIMGAEDYGFYTHKVPSCFYRVATGDAAPAHSPQFRVEDRFIRLCTRSMASLAVAYLNDFSEAAASGTDNK